MASVRFRCEFVGDHGQDIEHDLIETIHMIEVYTCKFCKRTVWSDKYTKKIKRQQCRGKFLPHEERRAKLQAQGLKKDLAT